MKRILIALGLCLAGAILGIALHFGWIGHRSIEWQEFRAQFASGEFREVRFERGKVSAIYRDARSSTPLILHPPSDPLPETDQKWFIVTALKHGVKVVFERTGEAFNLDRP